MKANLICLLIAVAAVSFAVGSVAQAGPAGQARVQKVKDSSAQRWLIETNTNLALIQQQLYALCKNVRETVPSSPYRGDPPSCDVGPFSP